MGERGYENDVSGAAEEIGYRWEKSGLRYLFWTFVLLLFLGSLVFLKLGRVAEL